MRRPRCFLDANVLVDAQLRDLFCTLAEIDAIDVRWSAEVLAEMEGALISKLRINREGVERLVSALTGAFPEALSSPPDGWSQLELPDPDPRGAVAVDALLRLPGSLELTHDMIDVDNDSTPHGSMRMLVRSLEDGADEAAAKLVHPDLCSRLTGGHPEDALLVASALRAALADALNAEDWGLMSGRRPLAPDREVVRLGIGAGRDEIDWTPQQRLGYNLIVVYESGGWMLADIA